MLSLLFLLFVVLMFFLLASAIARAGRRRRMLEAQRQWELERRMREDGGGVSPFAGVPFGGLFEAMMGGANGWTRTMEYDERSGRWVDVSSAPTAEAPTPDVSADEPRHEQRFSRASARRGQPANPLTSLLGGAMGGANSEFRVQRPHELVSFADVGGMDAVKQAGCCSSTPTRPTATALSGTGCCFTGRPASGRRSSPRRSPASTA